MKRNWRKGLLALVLAVGLCLGGCTVERPEDLASGGATQSSQISGEGNSSSLEENASALEQDVSQASDAASGSSQSDAASGGQTGSGNANGATGSTNGEKDQYQTDPVPEGKPKPQEPQDTVVDENTKLTCTLTIRCDTILDHMDQFNKDKLSVLPADGIIYSTRQVTFYEGESVFDVLLRETRKNRIHMEFENTPIYNSNYIEGINNIYEFDCGELSGWMYCVNGWYPNYGCSRYVLQDGDVIQWNYTCDLGRDLGVDWLENGQKN